MNSISILFNIHIDLYTSNVSVAEFQIRVDAKTKYWLFLIIVQPFLGLDVFCNANFNP